MDVTKAYYNAIDNRKVRVEGAMWNTSKNYTVKLEGAKIAGYQSSMLVLLRDKNYVANAEAWTNKLLLFLQVEINNKMHLKKHEYTLDFRHIGLNATLGELEKKVSLPTEVGILCTITSENSETSTEIAKLINPFLLHFPLTLNEELPTFAFPYSPVHSDRGCIYEFTFNHVLELSDPMSAFHIETLDIQ
jgi:hypothetical protein